jgi:hypothetical protein
MRRDNPQQEDRTAENGIAELQEAFSQQTKDNTPQLTENGQQSTDNGRANGFDFPLAARNVRAYQAKILEMTQVNMQLTLEFSQRLAKVRSPFEFLAVLAEFASRSLDILRKNAKGMSPYQFWRVVPSQEPPALPGR